MDLGARARFGGGSGPGEADRERFRERMGGIMLRDCLRYRLMCGRCSIVCQKVDGWNDDAVSPVEFRSGGTIHHRGPTLRVTPFRAVTSVVSPIH